MKQSLLILFGVLVLVGVAGKRAAAQSFGMEQNTNGTYTFTWPDGTSITTNSNGSYSSSNSTGSCSGCVQTLPEVVVYGYVNNSNNTYSYTSYNYQGNYYDLPPDPTNPYSVPGGGTSIPPAIVINTGPTPVVPPPPVKDPCMGAGNNQNGAGSPYNMNNASYSATVSSLTSTLSTDPNEKSCLFGVNTTNGQFITTNVVTGGAGSTGGVTIPPGMMLFGAMHTHTNTAYPTPSAGDIYALAAGNAAHSSYNTSYVLAADGSRYALVVQDPNKLATFISTYPPGTTVKGDDWIANNDPTSLYQDWKHAYDNYNPSGNGGASDVSAFENAQAYILSTYNTGIALMKADASGNFKEVHIVRATDANGVVHYSTYKCN